MEQDTTMTAVIQAVRTMAQHNHQARLRTIWRQLPFGEQELAWILTRPTSRFPLDGLQFHSRAAALENADKNGYEVVNR